MSNRSARHLFGLLTSVLVISAAPALPVYASVMVPGGVAGGGAAGSAGGTFTFDTGADETLISRTIATGMGLLVDANNDGTPDLADGMKNFNGGEVMTWCFDNVSVAAIDSVGNNCVTQTTVYVSKNNDSWGSTNLLGRPWQIAVDACYRAKTQTVSWPWQQPAPTTPKKSAVPKGDTKSGELKSVFENIALGSGFTVAPLDMTFYSGSDFSFIPANFANALGFLPLLGTIDLSVADPELLDRMSMGNQNMTQQTVFDVVEIELVELNLSAPLPGFGPTTIQMLVSDDLNSDFGIMGDNMLQFTDGIHELLHTSNDAFGDESLYYTQLPPWFLEGDLDGDGFVGIADLNIVLSAWNQTVPPADPAADPSGDNFVGIADLNVVLGNWNAGTPPSDGAAVPEPATLALLGIGGVLTIGRRR